jgi:transcriptional regulator with XRE-family HTH domain
VALDEAIKEQAKKDLGLTLKELRHRKGIKSAQMLADMCDFHPSHIANIERGAANPSFALLVQVVQRLDISLAELAGIYDEIGWTGPRR